MHSSSHDAEIKIRADITEHIEKIEDAERIDESKREQHQEKQRQIREQKILALYKVRENERFAMQQMQDNIEYEESYDDELTDKEFFDNSLSNVDA